MVNRWTVLTWLFAGRIIYTINWVAISPALPLIARDLNLQLTDLGLIGTSFLIGIGLFQIPSGVLAAKMGARRVSLAGLGLSSLFSALSAVAPSFELLLATRFAAGAFMALFFGPGISLFSPLFGQRERGLALGIYNMGFHVGSLMALGGWSQVIDSVGWRTAVLIPGLLGVAITAPTAFTTRGLGEARDEGPYLPKVRFILGDRDIWLLAIALTISGGTWYAVTQFGVLYLTSESGLTIGAAGLLVALMSLGSVLGSPLSGKLYDISKSKVHLLMAVDLGLALGLGALVVRHVIIFGASMFLLGLLYTSSFTIAYLLPMQYRHIDGRYTALAIGMINGVQLLGGAVFPPLFAVMVHLMGYTFSWGVMGLMALAALPFIYRLREP
ncbi:putative sulfoacetate transporter SauU [archaeon HR01]|nr:putative sulfoacetate transporter SauU [archaeon HR01]